MKAEAAWIFLFLLLAACGFLGSPSETLEPSLIPDDTEFARETLVAFFDNLHAGRYPEAAALYGGDYDMMIDHNPEIDPRQHAALFRNACLVNGAQCLRIRSTEYQGMTSSNEYQFMVEFLNDDGSLFVLGPCCGGNETDQPPLSRFPFTVEKEGQGRYVVLEPPVYSP